MDNTTTQDGNIAADVFADIATIEAAIASAKQHKTRASTRPARSDAERDAERAQRDADRAAKRLARQAARDARPARKTAHLAKVERAAAGLPSMNEAATALFNEASTNLSADQIDALARQLLHTNRVAATLRALEGPPLTPGTAVRILRGPSKFVGATGTIERAQRIRCYVAIPGTTRPIYLFTSDVAVIP